MKNIKNDLVVINYIKENNPVQSIKDDLMRYYEEHSCAKKEDIKAYLEENFTIGALLEMIGKTPAPVVVETAKEKCTTEQRDGRGGKGLKRITKTTLNDKTIVYDQLKDVDTFKSQDFVLTKSKPNLNGNDVLAIYTLGRKKDELIDLMYVMLDGKYLDLKNQKSRIVKNYLQCLDKTPHSAVSYCKLNNIKRGRSIPVYNKKTDEVYESVKECAIANNIPLKTLQNHLKLKKGDFEYL